MIQYPNVVPVLHILMYSLGTRERLGTRLYHRYPSPTIGLARTAPHPSAGPVYNTMPHRPGEICERCHRHIHPQTAASTESSHSLPACASCLPLGDILLTCGGCKLTRYCVSHSLYILEISGKSL